jgi:hypothetical protein
MLKKDLWYMPKGRRDPGKPCRLEQAMSLILEFKEEEGGGKMRNEILKDPIR